MSLDAGRVVAGVRVMRDGTVWALLEGGGRDYLGAVERQGGAWVALAPLGGGVRFTARTRREVVEWMATHPVGSVGTAPTATPAPRRGPAPLPPGERARRRAARPEVAPTPRAGGPSAKRDPARRARRSRHTGVVRRYLSRKEVAEALGISVPTLVTYMQRGDFPEPDAVIGTTRGWSQATVDRVVGRRAQSVRVRNVRAARADADGE